MIKARLLVLALTSSMLLFACELIVDFDRTKIVGEELPETGAETSTPETGTPDTGPNDTGATDAADAADAADSNDGGNDGDAAEDG
jgi:hypothetical protein